MINQRFCIAAVIYWQHWRYNCNTWLFAKIAQVVHELITQKVFLDCRQMSRIMRSSSITVCCCCCCRRRWFIKISCILMVRLLRWLLWCTFTLESTCPQFSWRFTPQRSRTDITVIVIIVVINVVAVITVSFVMQMVNTIIIAVIIISDIVVKAPNKVPAQTLGRSLGTVDPVTQSTVFGWFCFCKLF